MTVVVSAGVPLSVSLSVDELAALAWRVGISEFPTVLDVRLGYPSVAGREAAVERATRRLVSRQLVADGVVDPEWVVLLQALARPDREVAVRLVTPDGIARISVVRRGSLGVLARRIGAQITVRTLEHGAELSSVTAAVLAELPAARAAEVVSVGAPMQEMVERLGDTRDPRVLADRVRGLGVEPRAAMTLGSALGSREAFAEIVSYALGDEDGRIRRAPGVVAVFYTTRGRLVAAPSRSPAGQVWTTLKSGTDHAISQAIGQLAELSDDGWGMPAGR
jgi:hypothetical protein